MQFTAHTQNLALILSKFGHNIKKYFIHWDIHIEIQVVLKKNIHIRFWESTQTNVHLRAYM